MMKNFRYYFHLVVWLFILPLFILPGCYVRQAYYVSPFNGNTGDYQTIPLHTDSSKSAFYVNATYIGGSANDRHKDYYNAFRTAISRSQNFGIFQAYYGLDLTLGGFSTGRWDTIAGYPIGPIGSNGPNYGTRPGVTYSPEALNHFSATHFFGGTGFNGGINLVLPTRGGEWRALGVETSLKREFGDYLAMRKKLPDTAATLIVRSDFFGTIGLTTEIVGKTKHGEFGCKAASGWVIGNAYRHLNIYDNANGRNLGYGYTNVNFHYTYRRYTGFIQLNTATKATSFHMGCNYRL